MLKELRELLQAAVEKNVNEDTGVLLSGGIDSSTIAHFAGDDVPLFTGYYDGEPFDERRFAQLMVNGRDWHQIRIQPDDFVTHFDDMLAAIEPPFAGPGTFGQYMVARYASLHVSRVLSGEGGDELFGGYARLHLVAGKQVPEGYEDYVLPIDYPRDLDEALKWEWEVNLPALLRVDEQVTRAWSLEAIAPMTDSSVSDFVLWQTGILRVGKVLLKGAMEGLLPDEIIARKDKRGFPVPFVSWAQEEPVRSFVQDRIGYIPDPDQPWARQWWLDLCEAGKAAVAA